MLLWSWVVSGFVLAAGGVDRCGRRAKGVAQLSLSFGCVIALQVVERLRFFTHHVRWGRGEVRLVAVAW